MDVLGFLCAAFIFSDFLGIHQVSNTGLFFSWIGVIVSACSPIGIRMKKDD